MTKKQIGVRPDPESLQLLEEFAWEERTTVSKQALLAMVKGLKQKIRERAAEKGQTLPDDF